MFRTPIDFERGKVKVEALSVDDNQDWEWAGSDTRKWIVAGSLDASRHDCRQYVWRTSDVLTKTCWPTWDIEYATPALRDTLFAIRESASLTQSQLGSCIGMQQNNIHRYEGMLPANAHIGVADNVAQNTSNPRGEDSHKVSLLRAWGDACGRDFLGYFHSKGSGYNDPVSIERLGLETPVIKYHFGMEDDGAVADALRVFIERLHAICETDISTIYIRNPVANAVELFHHIGLHHADQVRGRINEASAPMRLMRDSEVTHVPSVQDDSNFRKSLFCEREGIRSVIYIPIEVQHLSAIIFLNYREGKIAPSPGYIRALQTVPQMLDMLLAGRNQPKSDNRSKKFFYHGSASGGYWSPCMVQQGKYRSATDSGIQTAALLRTGSVLNNLAEVIQNSMQPDGIAWHRYEVRFADPQTNRLRKIAGSDFPPEPDDQSLDELMEGVRNSGSSIAIDGGKTSGVPLFDASGVVVAGVMVNTSVHPVFAPPRLERVESAGRVIGTAYAMETLLKRSRANRDRVYELTESLFRHAIERRERIRGSAKALWCAAAEIAVEIFDADTVNIYPFDQVNEHFDHDSIGYAIGKRLGGARIDQKKLLPREEQGNSARVMKAGANPMAIIMTEVQAGLKAKVHSVEGIYSKSRKSPDLSKSWAPASDYMVDKPMSIDSAIGIPLRGWFSARSEAMMWIRYQKRLTLNEALAKLDEVCIFGRFAQSTCSPHQYVPLANESAAVLYQC